jgi:hypothetical protein
MIPRLERHALNRPGAEIVPYPLAQRRDLVVGIAAQVASRPIRVGEKHLQHQLRRQEIALGRKGVSTQEIARQVRSLEAAVRAELWRIILTPHHPDGAA